MRLILGVFAWLALFVSAPALPQSREQGVRDSAPSGLLASVARVNIDPPATSPMMNWGSATHILAEGIDPLGMHATALALSDGRQTFVIVDIDATGVTGLNTVVERAARQTGVPASNIRISASHTHSQAQLAKDRGPAGVDLSIYQPIIDRRWAANADKMVALIERAVATLKPAHMYAGRGIGTININRRFRAGPQGPAAVGLNPDGFVDRELVVGRIDGADGRPMAILVNFGAHGTVLGAPNRVISPDWPGAMRRTIEENFPGATALFLQGAAGNLGPIEGYTGDLEVAHRLGRTLGLQAAGVAATIDTVKRAPVFTGYVESAARQARQYYEVAGPRDQTLRYATRIVKLPRRVYTMQERAELSRDIELAEADVAKLSPEDKSRAAWQLRAKLRRLLGLRTRFSRVSADPFVKLQIHALRIGDVAIVSVPGEPFSEIGYAIKKASPFAFTMFSGYSTGVGSGYMPTDEEYRFGGYEVEITPYGIGSAGILIEESIKLLNEMK